MDYTIWGHSTLLWVLKLITGHFDGSLNNTFLTQDVYLSFPLLSDNQRALWTVIDPSRTIGNQQRTLIRIALIAVTGRATTTAPASE
jgi:hypothetical protein